MDDTTLADKIAQQLAKHPGLLPSAGSSKLERSLDELVIQLRQQNRNADLMPEFTMTKLVAMILQFLAVVALIAGLYAMFSSPATFPDNLAFAKAVNSLQPPPSGPPPPSHSKAPSSLSFFGSADNCQIKGNKLPKPTVWEMVKEAVHALGGATTNTDVRKWVQNKYPNTNRSTINCQLIAGSVNCHTRVYYIPAKVRRADNPELDIFFRPSKGQIELYDPTKHGYWEIYRNAEGKFSVRQSPDAWNGSLISDSSGPAVSTLHSYVQRWG